MNVLDSIGNGLGDVAHWMLHTQVYIVILLLIICAYLIWLTISKPLQNIIALVILIAVWIVVMPTGTDATKTVWDQHGFHAKVVCAGKLSQSLDWWNYTKPPSDAC